MNGNITVEDSCELKTNAELVGDIQAGTLSIEPGATFMGQSSVGKGLSSVKTPPAAAPASDKKAGATAYRRIAGDRAVDDR